MIRLLTALAALILMASPSTALAADPPSRAPAGNSAIDEYIETVPGATGATVARPPATKGAALTPSARTRLERLGRDGQALAAAIDATTPAPAAGQRAALPDAPPSRSALRAVLDGAAGGDGGGGGMGMLLPAILLGSLFGAAGLVLARRHVAS